MFSEADRAILVDNASDFGDVASAQFSVVLVSDDLHFFACSQIANC